MTDRTARTRGARSQQAPEGRRGGGATLQESRPSRRGRRQWAMGGATGLLRAAAGDLSSFVFLFFFFKETFL